MVNIIREEHARAQAGFVQPLDDDTAARRALLSGTHDERRDHSANATFFFFLFLISFFPRASTI